jgi:uncharacterized iron-regulated protein
MKRFLKFLCMCLIMSMAESAHAALPTVKDIVIISAADRKAVTLAEMAKSFVDYDVVFFGEFHDQDVLHELEYEMLQQLYAIHGDKLVLSLEMFEADNQSVLNEYLDGKITEEEFLAKSRPWPRYKTDYRQLVEFAKVHKLPVLASNIPRFLAAKLAKEGTLVAVAEQDKQYLPVRTYAPEGKYKEKFAAYMTKGQTPMRIPQERINQVFAAQCIKDDKMAESIFYYWRDNQDKVIFHVNGCFHSDGHLGTVEKLEALNPALKVGVITPKAMPKSKNYMETYADDKKDGEYIIYFPRVEKE